ncbi:transglycosylase SLT domain-containing protein [Mesorhizobium sp. 1B3]|uniref:transglycosylase SLT domain-containing protein n=1 Tax=Mesorhizobium sp. 1B3 TaxID=3243599 RepID=UPI003D953E12
MGKTPRLLVPGMLLLGLVSGCTTSSDAVMASADGLSATSTFSLALPETVSVMPSLADGTAVAVIESAAEDADAPVAVAYAGPTPSANPLAATSTAAAAPVVNAAVHTEAGAQPAVMEARAVAAPAVVIETDRNDVDRLITQYAAFYEVPVELVRRVVKRESNFFPGAYNNGHWGLMQIKHATARGMGYRGSAKGLLDAETNLKYAVKYLRGAYLVADGDHNLAVRYYARGYYYDAKRKGLLEETGLGIDRRRRRI